VSSPSSVIPVGRVVGLWRYPVKSMRGEALTRADVSWHGVAGDRRWALVRDEAVGSGFPWLTLRERPDLAHHQPVVCEPARPDRSAVLVRTPAGATFDVADPALVQAMRATGVRAVKLDRGAFDTFPLSLVTRGTIDALSRHVGMPLEVARFRPNVLVEACADEDFAEDRWVGGTLRIGSLRLRVDKRDGRCVVITIDPTSAERHPAVLRAVAAERQGCLGVYASTVEPGQIALDDEVLLER
jgi:uncharacterized protein